MLVRGLWDVSLNGDLIGISQRHHVGWEKSSENSAIHYLTEIWLIEALSGKNLKSFNDPLINPENLASMTLLFVYLPISMSLSETYLEPCETSSKSFIAKTVNS